MISPEPTNKRIQSDQVENYLFENQHGTAKFNYDSPQISRFINTDLIYRDNNTCISNFGQIFSGDVQNNI